MPLKINPVTGLLDLVEDTSGFGTGTVTSIGGANGVRATPNPITTTGTLELDVNSLTTETTLATGDLFPFVDVSAGTDPDDQRKVTLGSIAAAVQALESLVDGTGVAGQVAFWSDADTLTGENALFWDATNDRLGVGTAAPGTAIDIVAPNAAQFRAANTTADSAIKNFYVQVRHFLNAEEDTLFMLGQSVSAATSTLAFGGSSSVLNAVTSIQFWTAATGTTLTGTERMRITSDGSVLIGTTTTVAGSRLRVLGGDIETDNQVVSTTATGTSPLVVSSTTLVANLNADLLDGLDSAAFQLADADLTQIAAVANVRGDLLVTDAGPTWVRLGVGAANTVLRSDGTDPSWSTGVIDNNARVAVSKNSGATVGTRRRVNLIEGANVTLTIADDAGNEEVDVTIAAASPGTGTVTSVAGGVGVTNSPEPITTTGTVDLDINTLTTETVIAAGDLFPFVDVSVGTTPASQRKITFANLTAGLQPLDADLTALAALGTTGIVVRTGAATYTTRTLVEPAAGIDISNADGVAGDPTFALVNDLAALEGLAGTGIAVRSAADTWVQRSIAVTDTASVDLSITNGDGVAGNPTLSATVLAAGVDHGGLGGLADDDHAQYLLLAGRTGATNDPIISTSQTANIYGTNQSSNVAAPRDLNIESTSHANKGQINLKASTLVHSVLRTGTGTISTLGTSIVGVGTVFQDEMSVGDTIIAAGYSRHIVTLPSQISVTVDRTWPADLAAGTAFTYQRPILKFQRVAGTTTGFLTPDDYLVIGSAVINATTQANLSVNGTQPASSAGTGSEAPRVMFVQGAKGGNTTGTGGENAGNGGRFNLVAGAGGDASGITSNSGSGGAWTATAGAGGTLSAAGGGVSGVGGAITFAAGAGGPLTGAASGSAAGVGGNVSFSAGAGGTAIAANTRGNGGNFTIRPGLAGTGAGTGGTNGAIRMADLGGNVIVGSTTDNGERLGVAGDFATRAADLALANGNNDNIAIGLRSFIRVTGPTAGFAVRGIASGTDGKHLVLYNTTTQIMTINDEDAGSTAANRIRTMTGAAIATVAEGNATLIYDATQSRWIVTALSA